MGDTPSLPISKIEAEDRHTNFYDARVNLILPGHAATVAAAIRRKAATLGLDPTRRKNADTTATYLINKKPYLDYPTALAAGWPIATGIIEGACRQLVKGRMDITGARRGLDGAVPKPSCGYAP